MPLLASAMAAGALSGACFLEIFSFIVAAAVLGGGIVFAAWPARIARCARIFALLATVCFCVGAGLAFVSLARTKAIVPAADGHTRWQCEGEVQGPPKLRAWGAVADVRLLTCQTRGRTSAARGTVRLSMGRAASELMPGEHIRFAAVFSPAREFKNPGGFSYRRYLEIHGIGATGRVKGSFERQGGGDGIAAAIERLRRRIGADVAAGVSPPARGIVLALAIGEEGEIDPELREDFAETGLAHLLAISGLNVGYVAVLLFFLARALFGRFPVLVLRLPTQRAAAILTIPAVWGYVLLTGSALSAIRAAIMLSVALAGVIIGRRQDPPTTLAAAVIAVLLVLPLSALDLSFQLSVAAVAGMIIIAPRLMASLRGGSSREGRWRWMLHHATALLAVTLAATVATAPLIAYHFHFVSVVGLLANMIAVPLSGAVLTPPVAAATVASLVVPPLAPPLWTISGCAAQLLIWFAHVSAAVGGPGVIRWAPSVLEAILFAAALAVVVFWRRLPWRRAVAVGLAAIVIADAGVGGMMRLKRDLVITVLDVGQGDATLVQFPDGRRLLIDGGGIKGSSFDVGKNIVAPALWRMGIHRLDWLLLSHPHYDHYRGLAYIAAHFSPELVWTNGLDAPPSEAGDWEAFTAALSAAGVPLVPIGSGVRHDAGGATLEITSAAPSAPGEFNDTSLVADIRYSGRRFLFVGDLSHAGEQELVKRGGDLAAAFLKVGHHGSADASGKAFLKAVRPELAAISVGEHNRYGMPAGEVLQRLQESGARIVRTDLDGAITIESDGEAMTVETFVKR